MRIEQFPELRELLQRARAAFTVESAGGAVENLTPAAKRWERQQQTALRVGRVGAVQRRLHRDEVAPRERRKHRVTSRRIETRGFEQSRNEIGMADINLNVIHPASFEGGGGERDALGIGREAGRAHELAPGLKALPAPSRVERLVAQHRARVAEAKRKRPIVELGRDDAGDADGPLADQREERAVGVHERKRPDCWAPPTPAAIVSSGSMSGVAMNP